MVRASATLLASPKARAIIALRSLISEGGLREGDRLPAENRLAAEFEVSRMTLRSALDVLEREGLVRREHNLGCVCAVPGGAKQGLMSRTIVLLSDHEPANDGQVFTGASSSIVSGVIDRVNRHKFNFLRIHPDWSREAWFNELVVERPCGVIVSFWSRPIEWQLRLANRLAAAGVPFVMSGDHPSLSAFDHVASDHVGGTEQLVAALAERGKKRILRMWSVAADSSWIQAHNRGYERACAALGLQSLPAVQLDPFQHKDVQDEADFQVRVRRFAGYLVEHMTGPEPIDAVMTATDSDAFAALAACRLFGCGDIPVTGYDNRWKNGIERQWENGLPFATIEKSNHRLGEELVELLFARIDKTLPVEPQERLIEQQIVLTQ